MTILEQIAASEAYQQKLLADPYRPGYHFAVPGDNGCPGDPNGAFFADGRYHLMYLYRNHKENAFHWGHISSHDLLCWRRHPDALTVDGGDGGCYSGGAFLDEDGTAYLSFWKFPAMNNTPDCGGLALASSRPPYDKWERMTPIAVEGRADLWGVADITVSGETVHIGCADPGNIFKANGWYYMQAGNLMVLDHFGRKPDSEPRYRGGWTELFRSRDLKHWEYCHRFYTNPTEGEELPDETEDAMCPSLLPLPDRKSGGKLTDRFLQLFISHNRGAQYYIGKLEGEAFLPERHGRLTWKDNSYFAPEALVDDRNRQISWSWLLDNDPESFFTRYDWNGVFSFPRCFWLENGELRMAPAEELDRLMYNRQCFEVGVLDGSFSLAVKNGASFRLQATIDPKEGTTLGFRVRADEESAEYTEIGVSLRENLLFFDASHSGTEGRNIREEAPFPVVPGEKISLDIFVDKSVMEVYANERQAICRRILPTRPEKALSVFAFGDGCDFGVVTAAEMSPTNFY